VGGIIAGQVRAELLRVVENRLVPIPGTEGINAVPGADLSGMDLQRAYLSYADLTDATFERSDLRGAFFLQSTLTNANFSDARIEGVVFVETVGLTPQQVYSTSSYQGRNLQAVQVGGKDLSGWNLRDVDLSFANLGNANLTNASLSGATLKGTYFLGADLENTDFSSADIRGADLTYVTRSTGFTESHLHSTRSYVERDLSNVNFSSNDLSNWSFANQSLGGASFRNSTLSSTDFSGALIPNVDLSRSNITLEQLRSTRSYQERNLLGIDWTLIDLIDWEFHDQNLANSVFGYTPWDCCDLPPRIRNVDFSGASLSNVWFQQFDGSVADWQTVDFSGANLSSADLRSLELLRVAKFDGSTVYNQWTMFPERFDPVEEGLTFVRTPTGDFDGDGLLTTQDVDSLLVNVGVEFANIRYDLNIDTRVDQTDVRRWLHELKHTWFGDANLDGRFDSTDLVAVFNAGEYQDWGYQNSTWSTGDWTGDREFTTTDLIVALADGGYEMEAPSLPTVVPEPPGVLLAIGWVAFLAICSPRRSNPRRTEIHRKMTPERDQETITRAGS
jgi:uncharacterized protein YjbI with pentapeptide repeats